MKWVKGLPSGFDDVSIVSDPKAPRPFHNDGAVLHLDFPESKLKDKKLLKFLQKNRLKIAGKFAKSQILVNGKIRID